MTKKQHGLTIIEMLVVIVITSLLVTVMMQGFTFTLNLYHRVVAKQQSAYQSAFVNHWLGLTLGNLVAPREKDVKIRAHKYFISAETFNPLLSDPGVKTKIEWELVPTNSAYSLIYREADVEFEVFAFSESNAAFEFQSADRVWHDVWPVEFYQQVNLPEAIRISFGASNFLVNVQSRKAAEVYVDEVMFGRD